MDQAKIDYMQFKTFTNKLLSYPSDVRLKINNRSKEIKAFVRLTSIKLPDCEYWKIRFTDDSYMLIMMADQEVYYSDNYTFWAKEVKDIHIGRKKNLTFRGKHFVLGNKDDYQFVIEMVHGSPLDIEGECRFSDYFPIKGEKEFFSLGWLSRTGKRADIYCKLISLENISIIDSKHLEKGLSLQ